MGYPEPFIVVNQFSFCLQHGEEHCRKCFYDHRPTNVYAIRDKIPGEVSDDRPSINVYVYGAIATTPSTERTEFKCSHHGRVDCQQCFDWITLLREECGFGSDAGSDAGSSPSSQE